MTLISKRTFLAGCALALAGVLPDIMAAAHAQGDAWPAKPVRMIVPFPAGGTSDIMGRLIAEQLGKALKQPFIVENKGGAGGTIGSEQAAKAPADGYTLLLSGIGSNAIAHGMTPKPNYDSSRDFIQISQLIAGPNVLVVNPAFPAKTFKEFVDYVKANPGKVNYGVTNASSGHLAMELLKQTAGLNMVGIPYRGGGPALTDVLANQIPTMFVNQDAVLPYVKAGKLRALAVTSAQRNALFPDVPTVAESGYPGFSAVSWVGLSAPKGTPKPIVDKLEAEMMKAFRQPDVRTKLEASGFVVVASSSQDYARFVQSETERWGKVIKEAGIKPE
ncbi:tripartite tricarboxylate transporter substrate binding protein [Cupriavidus sp. CV2]|uniref:Bug family tripartite tricarboxylate transporter substrate binding protein n=1 Tax=Cupriavidus ulmosensis TaxID=3065913 RepID=UPI00296AB0DE|nr:tripartite tricarboxylate transporter substrate binding protein [Cupriavidus sp. CV2]MDW3682016.1 tripartite tricarboxylate transporter substrate binding protein [Cupriavidus sp. CV2]